MEIKGKVHCFFEQSGTFKREFIKLGIPAEDYDIQDNFGETDHVMDLFKEIDEAWEGRLSIFSHISQDDFVIAFFPCIYFCATSQMSFFWSCVNYRGLEITEKSRAILERARKRERFFELAVKMLTIASRRGIRLVMENPWSEQTYLKSNFVASPTMVDMDRTRRGDFFVKPTAYWFINCKPSNGFTFEKPQGGRRTIMRAKSSATAGICSEERSMISPAYAHNFICDNILGTTDHCRSQLEFDFA